MMDDAPSEAVEAADDFDWAPLGEAFWDEMSGLGYDRRQRKFACAIHRGSSQTEAARCAGFAGDEDSIRQAGHRAAKTNWCAVMLKLASSEAGLVGGPVQLEEALSIASSLARHGDPRVRLQALDQVAKLRAQQKLERENEADSELHSCLRILKSHPECGPVILADCYSSFTVAYGGNDLLFMPLLAQLAPHLKNDFPKSWARYRAKGPHIATELDKLGSGPLIPLIEIIEKAEAGLPAVDEQQTEAA